MSLLRQVDESRFLFILVRETHFSSGELLDERARAHVVTYTRGIYPPETVTVTSFPWELFGNRWGKFPRTGCPTPSSFPGLPASVPHGNAISFSPAIFLLSDAEVRWRRTNLRFPREPRCVGNRWWPAKQCVRRSDALSEIEWLIRASKRKDDEDRSQLLSSVRSPVVTITTN